jgi:hypothetical protein
VKITQAGKEYQGTCTHSPDYAENLTADYALCLLTEDVADTTFELINTDPNELKVGDPLLLTGFGCTQIGGGGGNDGVFRLGEALIQVLPAGDNNDIVTKAESALCYGDSGGPAFILYDQCDTGRRVQVSINSRGNIYDTSLLSSLSTPMAISFMQKWASVNKALICGLHKEAKKCRS